MYDKFTYLVSLVVPMAQETSDRYSTPTYQTFYSAYYQELLSEALVAR